jgi:haloacetate dehalogenase
MEIMPGFMLTDIETTGAQIRLRHGGNGHCCFCTGTR